MDKKDKDKLTSAEELFVDAYVGGMNGADAVRAAGYKGAARRQAYKLMRRERVKKAIEKRQAALAKRSMVTAERVTEELAHIAFAKITDVVEWRNKKISVGEDKDPLVIQELVLKPSDEIPDSALRAVSKVMQTQHGLRIEFHSKDSALDKLARHLGLYNDLLVHMLSADKALSAILEALPDEYRGQVLHKLGELVSERDDSSGSRKVQ